MDSDVRRVADVDRRAVGERLLAADSGPHLPPGTPGSAASSPRDGRGTARRVRIPARSGTSEPPVPRPDGGAGSRPPRAPASKPKLHPSRNAVRSAFHASRTSAASTGGPPRVVTRYRGTSVRRSAPGARVVSTGLSLISRRGQGLGFRSQNVLKSPASDRGSTIRFAWANPGHAPEVLSSNCPLRQAARSAAGDDNGSPAFRNVDSSEIAGGAFCIGVGLRANSTGTSMFTGRRSAGQLLCKCSPARRRGRLGAPVSDRHRPPPAGERVRVATTDGATPSVSAIGPGWICAVRGSERRACRSGDRRSSRCRN